MKKKLIRRLKKTKAGAWIIKKIRAHRRDKMCLELSKNAVVKEKQIIFSAFSGRLYACSPKAIYEYMLNDPKFDDYTFIWAFTKPDQKQHLFHNDRTILVKYRTKEFFKYLSTSKYWIFNFRTPPYFAKREDQIFVQCWHGTPLKRIGMDIQVDGNAATKVSDVHKQYLDVGEKCNYFISPSAYATKCFISSFGLDRLHKENVIIEQGYPRNASLFTATEEKLEKIRQELNIPKGKKVILYCPTFRDDQYKKGVGHTYQLGVNLLRLKEKLPKDCFLLLRLHYLVSNNIDISQFKGFAVDVSHYDDVNDLYLVSDLLVTDYSSVFFDFANLHRPVIFYMYDLEAYKNELRDFYFDIEELPGPIVQKESELIDAIKNVDDIKKKYADVYQKFCHRFNYLDDAGATERVVKEFMK